MTRHLPESLLLRGVGLPGGEADLADLRRRERWTGEPPVTAHVVDPVRSARTLALWARRRARKLAAA